MKYSMPFEKCRDCGRRGHTSSDSRLCGIQGHHSNSTLRYNAPRTTVKQMWVKKSDLHLYKIYDTNQQGPKVMWVPKR